MPLQKLQFRPGVNREGTTLANEGGWFDCDKVRFRSGYPEKIGGWAAISYNTFLGVARALINWITLKGYNLLGVGTNQKMYVENGGSYYDITPLRIETGPGTPAGGTVIFAATNDSYKITVTNATGAGFQAGDFVTFSGAISLGGVITAGVLNQQYQIQSAVDSNTFVIYARTAGTTVENPGPYVKANSSDTGNGNPPLPAAKTAKAAYQINAGYPVYTVGTGWGTGPWPVYTTTTLTNPFTASGVGVSELIVTHNTHNLSTGDYVVFSSIQSDACGISRLVLQKAFQITKIDANSYTISTVIGSPPTQLTYVTTSTTASGGTVVVEIPSPPSRGWGAGFTTGIGLQLRLWSQAIYDDYLLFAPRGGAIYKWEPGSGPAPAFTTRAEVITGTEVPEYVNQIMISEVALIVLAFGCQDYSTEPSYPDIDPMLIRWSVVNDYSDWLPTPENQAGFIRLSHGSEIICALQTRQEIVVWTDSSLYSLQYVGPPAVFNPTMLADNISIIGPNAMATANGVTYWMGTDKFYTYSGRVETLPCTLRQFIYNDINRTQNYQVFANTNEGYSEVWWFYCSQNSDINDRYVIYNYLDRVWYYGQMNRTSWLDSGLRTYPMAAWGIQNTLLAPVAPATSINATTTSIPVLNTSSFPDSGVLKIDDELIAYASKPDSSTLFTDCVRGYNNTTATSHDVDAVVSLYASNLIVYHEAAVDDGTTNPPSPISSYIQSSDFDIGDGHNYGFVWQIVTDVTFDGSSADNPEVQFVVRPRRNPGALYGDADMPDVTSEQKYGIQTNPLNNTTTIVSSHNVQKFTQLVYTRIRGRQMAFKVQSSKLGTQWQLGVPSINIRPDGRR